MGSAPPSRRKTLRRGLALAALAASLWALGILVPLPRIVLLRFSPPRTTAFIEARKARLRSEGKPDAIDRRPVPLSAVSESLVRAVLAAEDARFLSHAGIDWEAVQEARRFNRRQAAKRRPKVRGASTITQQLAKNLFLSPERSLWRKGREAAIALAMELLLPKRVILQHYLSGIEWGERVWGCEAAARKYFGTSSASLTRSQAAWLAAMIPGPRVFLANPARHERRAARILSRMAQAVEMGPLLADEADDDDAR